MKRVALIGVSGYAHTHYQLLVPLAEAGEIELCAATVINQEEESEKCRRLRSLGATLFTDYRKMLAPGDVDLCVIPTGIPLHSEMTCAALKSTASVLVEKPAAATIQDVLRMSRVAKEAGRFVAVGYQACYDPLTHELKRRLLAGAIGEIISLKARGIWPRPGTYYSRNQWAGRLKIGGAWVLDAPFSNAFSHYLNLMLFWSGSGPGVSATPSEVTAELYRAREIESADTAAIRVRTDEGPVVLFLVTHSARTVVEPEIVIRGTRGQVVWRPDSMVVERVGAAPEVTAVRAADHPFHMMKSVLQRLEDSTVFVCGLDIACGPTICANAAFESSSISSLDAAYVQGPDTADGIPVIDGIVEAIDSAFRQEALFSEIDAPWAQPGRPVSTSGYDHFPSRFRSPMTVL